MNRNDKDSAKRQEQEKLQTILNEILKEEDNKYCADCEAKGPRWASWNLGVFLCIRCAGIHRNLGVHISKVKSVNLDTWTVEQVQSVRVMGNSLAKALYEANLPSGFRRPQTDSSLEAFIRAKYEHKRYVDKDLAAPKVDPRDLMIELENLTNRRKLLTASDANATANIPQPPKTSPGSKRKEKKDTGRKPSGGGQKSVSSTNCSETSNINDLVDLSLDLGGGDSAIMPSSQAPKGTVDDLLGLADLGSHSHVQQPIRNHSSPFLPSFNSDATDLSTTTMTTTTTTTPTTTPMSGQTAAVTQKPVNLSPLAAADSGASFADFTTAAAVAANSSQAVADGSSSSSDANLFSLTGAGTANDKKSKDDILALYASGGGGVANAPTPSIPAVPFIPAGTVTSGYYAPYPAAVAPINYAYPTTVNPVPMVYGGVPSAAHPQAMFGVPQQPQQQMVGQAAFGYSVIPPQSTTFVQPSFNAAAVGGISSPGVPSYGNSNTSAVGQAAQLQHVREQLAALQIQRAQQPATQSNVVTNTLATNLWQ